VEALDAPFPRVPPRSRAWLRTRPHRRRGTGRRRAGSRAAAGDADAARAQHNRALRLATALGGRYEQARAHAGLAGVSEARSQTETARDQWHHALQLYDALAVPEADLARQRLAALTTTQP
jgi:hypothetical protein